jgi:hypothetical protein
VFLDSLAERFGRIAEFFEAVDDFLTEREVRFEYFFHTDRIWGVNE